MFFVPDLFMYVSFCYIDLTSNVIVLEKSFLTASCGPLGSLPSSFFPSSWFILTSCYVIDSLPMFPLSLSRPSGLGRGVGGRLAMVS